MGVDKLRYIYFASNYVCMCVCMRVCGDCGVHVQWLASGMVFGMCT